ncbi:leucocin A/sakacin P family class II bacteriocin [Enterococcus hirae]|nr:leucocin A/sakacin P family class II bacteriocin [Enterococcus hirae]
MKRKLFSLALIGIFDLVLTIFGTKVDASTHSYGNGVYCNEQKCWVNWNEPKKQMIGIVISGGAPGLVGI